MVFVVLDNLGGDHARAGAMSMGSGSRRPGARCTAMTSYQLAWASDRSRCVRRCRPLPALDGGPALPQLWAAAVRAARRRRRNTRDGPLERPAPDQRECKIDNAGRLRRCVQSPTPRRRYRVARERHRSATARHSLLVRCEPGGETLLDAVRLLFVRAAPHRQQRLAGSAGLRRRRPARRIGAVRRRLRQGAVGGRARRRGGERARRGPQAGRGARAGRTRGRRGRLAPLRRAAAELAEGYEDAPDLARNFGPAALARDLNPAKLAGVARDAVRVRKTCVKSREALRVARSGPRALAPDAAGAVLAFPSS